MSGVSSESGSPVLVMEDSVKQGALDALAIRYGGDVEAARQRSAANLYKMQGNNAMTAGFINAGSSLLSGASKTMGSVGNGNSAGSVSIHDITH
jgi:hypothetical protein